MKRILPTIASILALQFLLQPFAQAAGQQTEDWQRYLISAPDVVYPAVIERTGMHGTIGVLLTIDPKDGTVTEVKVLKHTGYRKLDAIYVLNFFQWRFKPGTIKSAKISRGVSILGRSRAYY